MSIGSQLRRAEMLSSDSSGKPIRKVAKETIGYTVMPVKETRPHALSHANTETTEEQEDNARREREARSRFLDLSDLDREILRLHLIRTAPREVLMPFPASQRDGLERAGWLYTKTSKSGAAMMVKTVPGQLTHAEIGEQVHLSVSQVRRRLNALDPALVKYAEMLGWV